MASVAVTRRGFDGWKLHQLTVALIPRHRDGSRANLADANFEGAELAYVNFEFAKLQRANLSGADLSNADPAGANLRGKSDRRQNGRCEFYQRLARRCTRSFAAVKSRASIRSP